MASTTEHAFFYNSENGDRVYDADSFELWLKKFFTSGVFTGELQVKEGTGMTIIVGKGYANVDGKVRFFSADESITLTRAHGSLDRIDTVVIERNDTDRDVTIKIVSGSPSDAPIPTEPIREGGIYQLVIAQILVKAGATKITNADITDTREDLSLCGMVTGTVKEVDFNQFKLQFEGFLQNYKEDATNDYGLFVKFIEELEAEATVNTNALQQKFTEWFDKIKGQLSEDAAGNLQNQIDTRTTRVLTNKIANAYSFTDMNDESEYPYRGIIHDDNIKSDDFAVIYWSDQASEACIISGEAETFDGGVYVFCSDIPESDLEADVITLQKR